MSKNRNLGRIGRTLHRIAYSSPVRKAKAALFYGPMAVAGISLADQVSRIPGVAENASRLEDVVSHAPYVGVGTGVAEFAGGVALLGAASLATKREKKRRDFQTQELQLEHLPRSQRVANALKRQGKNALLATGAGALLIGAYDNFPDAVEWLNTAAQSGLEHLSSGVGSLYDSVFVGNDHWYNTPAKVVGALGLTTLATRLHSRWSSAKHDPIKKTYLVDGYMPALRWTAGENIAQWVKSWKLRLFRDETMNLVDDDMRVTADVTVFDYKTGVSKPSGRIFFDPGLEPQRCRRELTDMDVASIRHILKSKATASDPEKVVHGKEIAALAEDAQVYAALVGHFKQSRAKNPPSLVDINSVLQVMQSPGYANTPIDDISDATLLQERKRTPVYERGGKFFREFWGKDAGGTLVKIASLGEEPRATALQSRREFGKDFLKRGKVCGVLSYRTLRGHDAHEDGAAHADEELNIGDVVGMEDHEFAETMDQEFRTQVSNNQVREIRKYGNTFLEHGLGGMYAMQFHGAAYTIEQEWTQSLPVWRDRALRRKFYVRDSSGKVVAKMQETLGTVVGKPLGNINWKIDVYNTELADTDAFGGLLCLMTDYLTHHRKYTANRRSDLVHHAPVSRESTEIE